MNRRPSGCTGRARYSFRGGFCSAAAVSGNPALSTKAATGAVLTLSIEVPRYGFLLNRPTQNVNVFNPRRVCPSGIDCAKFRICNISNEDVGGNGRENFRETRSFLLRAVSPHATRRRWYFSFSTLVQAKMSYACAPQKPVAP